MAHSCHGRSWTTLRLVFATNRRWRDASLGVLHRHGRPGARGAGQLVTRLARKADGAHLDLHVEPPLQATDVVDDIPAVRFLNPEAGLINTKDAIPLHLSAFGPKARALTAKLADNAIRVVDAFGIDEIRTKQVVAILQAFEAAGRILVVAPGRDEKLQLSARNLPDVEVILADSLNVVDLVNADTIIMEQAALATIQEVYG